ncbi:hypothetical protein MN0502_35430 (plasmid) [Arthrobacter sp. MN05-02]|nr:hypothetical protein MN0502_35430 [Arthrobacter sp. MN05-02]
MAAAGEEGVDVILRDHVELLLDVEPISKTRHDARSPGGEDQLVLGTVCPRAAAGYTGYLAEETRVMAWPEAVLGADE